MRALGQDRGGRAGATETRLTSSPQSVPQLFLMAQKGMPEPGEQCGVQGVRGPQFSSQGPQHFALSQHLLWPMATGTRRRGESQTGPPTTLLETWCGSEAGGRAPSHPHLAGYL